MPLGELFHAVSTDMLRDKATRMFHWCFALQCTALRITIALTLCSASSCCDPTILPNFIMWRLEDGPPAKNHRVDQQLLSIYMFLCKEYPP